MIQTFINSLRAFWYFSRWLLLALLAGCGGSESSSVAPAKATRTNNCSDKVLVAVASNFLATLSELKNQFEGSVLTDTGACYQVELVAGSSGKLYAQIIAGAPFDVFLSADEERPRLLADSGLAYEPFTYAYGKLVLWTNSRPKVLHESNSEAEQIQRLVHELQNQTTRKVAIANPRLAPYGRATIEVLTALGLSTELESKLVFGENVGQAHAMVVTGNADLGFTAASYLPNTPGDTVVTWSVPGNLHAPVVQQAVLLKRADSNPGAAAFVDFLASNAARETIRGAGYGKY